MCPVVGRVGRGARMRVCGSALARRGAGVTIVLKKMSARIRTAMQLASLAQTTLKRPSRAVTWACRLVF